MGEMVGRMWGGVKEVKGLEGMDVGVGERKEVSFDMRGDMVKL